MTPAVFVGLPVFNGEQFIREALDSLLRQTWTDWRLVISDNCSTDGTEAICKQYASSDERISYVRQKKNIGAALNFISLLERCDAEYFMWAASDDVWLPRFIETCLTGMRRTGAGMGFASICNVDTFGRRIRDYPKLSALSSRFTLSTLVRLILSPEMNGKANIIYSIYRAEICRQAMRTYTLNDKWGSDMAFAIGAAAISGLTISPEVLFHKRHIRPTDREDVVEPIAVPKELLDLSCPLSLYDEYATEVERALHRTRYALLAQHLMAIRKRYLERLTQRRLEQSK